jgi:UDP-N-acetylmuramoylalanine-D-glutamate ligase
MTIKNNDGKEFVEPDSGAVRFAERAERDKAALAALRGIDMDAWITRLTRSLAKRESARVQYHDCEDAVAAAITHARKQGVPAKRIEAILESFHEGSRY